MKARPSRISCLSCSSPNGPELVVLVQSVRPSLLFNQAFSMNETDKSSASADRRPVDPPPVVELRIYESDPTNMHKTDITFAYNANFFLYATLETARPIAHGRVAGPPTCPVLTGVPVAGVAYLDRPSQAGYFIFPDLSVRHEGRYRLSFHLYEEIKDLKDADKEAPVPSTTAQPLSKTSMPQSSLNFRLEVKSVPFTVYSAKKFPGLATSTSLSRIIAEQGCRVRIRRDVRMRRRGEKRADDFDFDEEQRMYAPPPSRPAADHHRFPTPDAYAAAATPIERPRSTSTSTVEPAFPYGPDVQRRPSVPEYGYPVAQPPYQRPMPAGPAPAPAPAPAPPVAAPHASPYASHLAFGPGHTYPAGPQLPPTPQSAAPPVQSTAPSVPPYSPHLSYAQTASRNPSISSEYEPTGYPYPQQPRPAETYKSAPLPPLRMEPLKNADPSGYSLQPVARSQTPAGRVPSLPPLSALPGPEQLNLGQSPTQETSKRHLYETPGSKLAKRSHEESFGLDERPLHNGQRPDPEEYPGRKLSDTASLFGASRDEMAYKRANGRMVMKLPPPLQ